MELLFLLGVPLVVFLCRYLDAKTKYYRNNNDETDKK